MASTRVSNTYTIKYCKIHGDTDHECNKIVNNVKYFKCKLCKNAKQSDLRKERKGMLIELMGGQCEICGYKKCDAALEFHHIDPTKKTLEFSKISRYGKYEDYVKETYECIMICANCHREVHEGLLLITATNNNVKI